MSVLSKAKEMKAELDYYSTFTKDYTLSFIEIIDEHLPSIKYALGDDLEVLNEGSDDLELHLMSKSDVRVEGFRPYVILRKGDFLLMTPHGDFMRLSPEDRSMFYHK